MRCEVFAYQEISSLPETAEDGLGESVERTGIAPIERWNLRRPVAAAGKKESVSISYFMAVKNLQVEEELHHVCWAEGVG